MPGYGGKYLNNYSDVLCFLMSKTGAIPVTTRPSPIMCAQGSQFLPAWLRSQSVLGERRQQKLLQEYFNFILFVW